MLIFDNFPSEAHARDFAAAVEKDFKLKTWFFTDQQKSNEVEPFPFELVPPIVLVERPVDATADIDFESENKVEQSVSAFGGTFAGT